MLRPLQNCGRGSKNQGFLHIVSIACKQKNEAKSIPKPFEQSFPQRSCPKPLGKLAELGFERVWGSLGRLWAGFWALLIVSWLLLAASGALSGTSWTLLGISVVLHGRVVASRAAPNVDFRRFGAVPGCIVEALGSMFCMLSVLQNVRCILRLALCYLMLLLMP